MDASVGRRMIVIGPSCSGKSTLARRLACFLDAAYIELDALYWEPGWATPVEEHFLDRVRRAVASPSWVMCGSYSRQQEISWPLADTIVWLDMPLHLVLRRLIARSWRRYRTDELLWGTNRERFWPMFKIWDQQASLVGFIVRTHRSRRRRYLQSIDDPRWEHSRFVRLRSAREVERWFAAFSAEGVAESAPEFRSVTAHCDEYQ